jgi:hypothetical protein
VNTRRADAEKDRRTKLIREAIRQTQYADTPIQRMVVRSLHGRELFSVYVELKRRQGLVRAGTWPWRESK